MPSPFSKKFVSKPMFAARMLGFGNSAGHLEPCLPITSAVKVELLMPGKIGMVTLDKAGSGLPLMPLTFCVVGLQMMSTPSGNKISSRNSFRVSEPISPEAAPGSINKP
jgi:hypothetical protein